VFVRAAQLRGRGSTLPNSGALVCLPTTLKAFDPACPNVYERSRCSGNFMYLAELCCSPVVVWILAEKRDSSPSSEGEQRGASALCASRYRVVRASPVQKPHTCSTTPVLTSRSLG